MADALLAVTAVEQHARQQRQRRAGEKGGRQHHQAGERAAHQAEQHEARIVAGDGRHGRGHQVEGVVVERDGQRRDNAHRHLHQPEEGDRRAQAVDTAAYPQTTQRQPGDEGRQHQFEGDGAGAEHHRQHADPGDLVDERGGAGEQRGREQQAHRRAALGPAALASITRGRPARRGEQVDGQRHQHVRQPRRQHGARDSRPRG